MDIQEDFLEKETFQWKFERKKMNYVKEKGEFCAERTPNAESLKCSRMQRKTGVG